MQSVMLDSNVIFSGIVFGGKPASLLKIILNEGFRLVIPEDQIEELYRLFKRKLPKQLYLLEAYIALQRSKIVPANRYSRKIRTALRLIRDKKDAPLLACALLIKPKYFITGDKDFHVESIKRNVNVLTPEEFIKNIQMDESSMH